MKPASIQVGRTYVNGKLECKVIDVGCHVMPMRSFPFSGDTREPRVLYLANDRTYVTTLEAFARWARRMVK